MKQVLSLFAFLSFFNLSLAAEAAGPLVSPVPDTKRLELIVPSGPGCGAIERGAGGQDGKRVVSCGGFRFEPGEPTERGGLITFVYKGDLRIGFLRGRVISVTANGGGGVEVVMYENSIQTARWGKGPERWITWRINSSGHAESVSNSSKN